MVWSGAAQPAGAEELSQPIDVGVLPTTLPFEEFLYTHFSKNRRNECSRSERRGMTVARSDDGEQLAAFYAIYAERCRMWGKPASSLAFFDALLRELDPFEFYVALFEGEVIGGHICVRQRDEYFLWLGTTKRVPKLFPATMLIREEVRRACELGAATLNLGSSTGLSGVANFKKLLGAESERRWVIVQESPLLAAKQLLSGWRR
jgi:CelD/BcsL family acetyltransferase involved in cellulose biosynthesis